MAEIATERVAEQAAEQTQRAVESGNPLLVLVFFHHEAEKLNFLGALRQELQERGVHHQTLDPIHRPDHGIGQIYNTLATASHQVVSLIPDLPHRQDGPGLDPRFLSYFNLHRDRIARERLRMVLCLHESDAEQFITEAGDLWDFRHRTYWLEPSAATRGPSLWQVVERLAQRVPLPASEREEIDQVAARIRKLVEEASDPVDKAALFLDFSRWLGRRQAAPLAAAVALEGLGMAPVEAKPLRAGLEGALAYALWQESRLAEALPHYETSLALYREIGDHTGEARSLNDIAEINIVFGRYNDALHALERSLAITRSIGDRAGEAAALNNIAQIHDTLGRFDEALRTWEESLAIIREIDFHAGEAAVLNNIAQLHSTRGNHDKAVSLLEQSLSIAREIGNRSGEAATLNNIAQIYHARGQTEQALRTWEQSFAIRREVGDRAGEARTLNNISQIYHAQGQYDEALRRLEESLALAREVGDRASEASALNNLARIYEAREQYEQAIQTWEQSLAILRDVGDPVREAITAWNLGREYARRGELVRAITLVQRTVEIDAEIGDPDLQKDRAYLQDLVERLERKRKPSPAVAE